ncbi:MULTISPECIES: DUF4192 domain-containing protein [unclassified Nocardia]|uniref:DUF4192 domain-containing protein n=1 Tax=unclassified Nocardia TaxID=2637762 RepID=UPI00278C311A|nr:MULTISPECIES: DUF4192 domain-containing protein [unclassified Nocardia]
MSSFEAVLKDPDQFIAAVPAMLGFVPERSLVVVAMHHEAGQRYAVKVAVRLDIPPAQQYAPLPEHLPRICRNSDADLVLAVLVDDRAARPDAGGDATALGQRRLVDRLRRALAGGDVVLAGAWATPRITAGAEWWDIDSPERHGLVPDPAASQVAAKSVLDGRVLRASRRELVDAIAVDGALREQVSAYLPTAVADAQRRLARAIQIDNPDAYTRMALCQVLSVITRTPGSEVSASVIADVAVALRDLPVRDIMFGVAGGAHAHAAEQLWEVLTRALPDPDRAQAATLLAFSAFLRGDGPLAGIALKQALTSDPDHRMAGLLDTALQMALPPARLRRLVDTGVEAAAELRVDIGATVPDSGLGVTR